MRVLITGGSGFLGKHVSLRLAEDPQVEQVYTYDNLDKRHGGDAIPFIIGNVSNYAFMAEMVKHHRIDSIVHLAAFGRNLTSQNWPYEAWETNVNGTLNVLEIARQAGLRVVCCSSNIVLCPDMTMYKATKSAVELLVQAYSRTGVSCIALRPCNIYGPGQSRTEYQPCAFASLDKAYAEKGCFEITGDGSQQRDWVHVTDVARAFQLALHSPCVSGQCLDIATGKLTSMNDVAELLGVRVEYVPARPGDAQTIVSDPRPAKDVLGFEYRIELEDAIFDAFPSVRARRL